MQAPAAGGNMESSEFTAREMETEDIPRILQMSRDNMSKIIYDSWGVVWDDNDLLRLLLRNSYYNEVLEAEGRIIAYFSVDLRDSILFVNSIQVDGDFRGRGCGSEMMERIEDIASFYNAEVVELWVQKTNVAARKFYYSRGFKMVCRQGNNYLMRKDVPCRKS